MIDKTCPDCGGTHPIERAEVTIRPVPGENIWDWLNGSLKDIIDDWESEGLEIEQVRIVVHKRSE